MKEILSLKSGYPEAFLGLISRYHAELQHRFLTRNLHEMKVLTGPCERSALNDGGCIGPQKGSTNIAGVCHNLNYCGQHDAA